jgi:hypothetical protein
MKTVRTYKELNEIVWTANQIKNDYVKGERRGSQLLLK